jgi:predicted ribosome quality control (RQC) complex YloA/Tae2 family protein
MMSSGYNMGLTLSGQKDFDAKNDALFLSSFIGSKSNVDAREFSKAETYIKGLDKRINSLKDKPEMFLEYARENPEEFALVQMYNQQVNGGLRALREAANRVRVDRTLTVGERKAQLDQIVQLQNAVKRNILAGFEAVSGYRP